jgi:hypothetical protein
LVTRDPNFDIPQEPEPCSQKFIDYRDKLLKSSKWPARKQVRLIECQQMGNMDWLTFIAQLISALAWPVTLIVIILVLRRPLTELFPLVRRLRFQGIELDFSREIQALVYEARGQLPRVHSVLNAEGPLRTQCIELAQVSPRTVVLESWIQLEKAAIDASRRHGLKLKSAELHSPLILGQALEESSFLEGNTPMIYHQLRNLRNAAAHASEFAFNPILLLNMQI